MVPLDEEKAREAVRAALKHCVEAIAVTLLWSFVNPRTMRVRDLIDEVAPDLPVTLSHELNPCLREYRRASAAAMDASLKPVMTDYIGSLERRLREAGLRWSSSHDDFLRRRAGCGRYRRRADPLAQLGSVDGADSGPLLFRPRHAVRHGDSRRHRRYQLRRQRRAPRSYSVDARVLDRRLSGGT